MDQSSNLPIPCGGMCESRLPLKKTDFMGFGRLEWVLGETNLSVPQKCFALKIFISSHFAKTGLQKSIVKSSKLRFSEIGLSGSARKDWFLTVHFRKSLTIGPGDRTLKVIMLWTGPAHRMQEHWIRKQCSRSKCLLFNTIFLLNDSRLSLKAIGKQL